MNFYSPLRYPGGKNRLANFLKLIIKENNISKGCYIEPYAGGASVALSLLFDGFVENIIINDYDKAIYSFWNSVVNRTDDFCKKLSETPISIEERERQRVIYKNKKESDEFDLGFATFYLNRTNRSGILTAGVIGGKEQKAEWKLDARFNKQSLIDKIIKIGQYRNKIKVYNYDACKLIEEVAYKPRKKIIFYFDPPYYVKGQQLYFNHYKQSDHKDVSQVIQQISKKNYWLVSYDNVTEIQELYPKRRHITYDLHYSAGYHSLGSEIMFFSDNLIIPKIESPLIKNTSLAP
jgi:DNA adenine methylase